MNLKKTVALGLAGVLLSGVFVMPVSAHGHHGSQSGCGYDHEHLCEVCAVDGSAGMSMTAGLTVVMIMWTVIVTEPVMRSESVRYPAVRRAGIMSMTAGVIADMIMRAAIATEPATA